MRTRRIVRLTIDGRQYHFTSLKTIYDMFTPEQIGVTYSTLRCNYSGQDVKRLKNCTVEYLTLFGEGREK